MATPALKPAKVAAIVTDWRIGKMSQRQLAKEHGVSLGAVSKLCKGVEQDGVAIVNAGTQYRQALAGHDERMVNAVEREVDERTAQIQFFTNATMRNVAKLMKDHVDKEGVTPVIEHKLTQDTIAKGKETVIGKTADTAVQINIGHESALAQLV